MLLASARIVPMQVRGPIHLDPRTAADGGRLTNVKFKRIAVILALALALVGAACSSDSDSGSSSTTEPSETETSEDMDDITILVTNDDGVDAEGIDSIVEALAERDGVEVVVVAPAENQSGSGQKTTGGELVGTPATTASGHEATAVDGFPADAVIWALGEGGIDPDLVISGINDGQNIAQLANISGTVGAARQAAQSGVPALAASQGFGNPPDFETGTDAVMTWLDENEESVRAGSTSVSEVASINIPTCSDGQVQGTVDVPWVAESDIDLNDVDCAGAADPVNDAVGFTNGWIVVSPLAITGSNT